jgi:MoaA/NifB/PqqE/SkfB family radical SAM enzyme
MNIPHDKFCVLPWVSLETSPIGTVRPCCLAEQEITSDAGDKFNLHTAEFGAIQNSKYMRDLRQQFLDGQQPETCRKCWHEESVGRTSKRMHTLDRLKHMLPEQEWTSDAKPLMFLDLKLGNICNLKCRICGSWSSSSFAVEEIAHDQTLDRKKTFHYQMLKQGRWPRENPVFWQQIANNVDNIRYLEFTGGEPFMIQEHFDFLQRLVDLGVSKNIEIHYNTNGTIYPDHADAIWQHFKLVEIAFSIDDVDSRFEYQRSGANWQEVQRNIGLFAKMRQQLGNIQLQVCTTVNVFNVLYLETVANWIDQQNFDFVYWNMLHEAPYLSIANLPLKVKQAATNKLQLANVSPAHKKEFERMISFMQRGVSSDQQQLIATIQRLDLRRNESLRAVQPELADLLNYD